MLDYGDGFLRLLSGRAISTVAVAGVAALYGTRGWWSTGAGAASGAAVSQQDLELSAGRTAAVRW